MTTLFLSYSPEDAAYVETLRQGLEVQGYTCWKEPGFPGPTDYNYPQMIENAIMGSATLILVWSAHAAQNAWVTRHILFAHRLKKSVILILLDATALPNTLTISPVISIPVTDDDTFAQLLPYLPTPDSQDPLLTLGAQASHPHIGPRKDAIDLAAVMLARNEHHEEVLAILDYLAQHDLMMGVREKAQGVLDNEKQKATPALPAPLLNPQDEQYMLGVRCAQCQYVTYFDRRRLCAEKRTLRRASTLDSDKDHDEMDLPCGNCKHVMFKHVDCAGL